MTPDEILLRGTDERSKYLVKRASEYRQQGLSLRDARESAMQDWCIYMSGFYEEKVLILLEA